MRNYLILACILTSFFFLPNLDYYLGEMEKQNIEIRKSIPAGGLHFTKAHQEYMKHEKAKQSRLKCNGFGLKDVILCLIFVITLYTILWGFR